MCFSASASFTAGALLSMVGTASIIKHKKTPYRFLAMTPLLFGLQQLNEGLIWITHTQEHTTTLTRAMPYSFLFFSLLLWPVWISSVLWPTLPKNNTWRKKALALTLVIGCITSTYFLFRLMMYGVVTSISCSHIMYDLHLMEQPYIIIMILYGCTTVLPCFISPNAMVWLLGIGLTVAYAITYFFYINFLTSIWCFFAAFLSSIILFIPKEKN